MTPPHLGPRTGAALAAEDIDQKKAFETAKELGTAEAWEAFLESFDSGFYAEMARAYLKKLGGTPKPTTSPAKAKPATTKAAADEKPAADPEPAKSDTAEKSAPSGEIQLGANASLGGRRLMPEGSPWNEDISAAAVDPLSEKILKRIGLDKPLRADFGTEYEGAPMGIPYVVIAKGQKKVPVKFLYAEESDAGPYPIPPDAPIEGGPDGDGDRHVIVLDRDANELWELFRAFPDGKGWKADSGAKWNLDENQMRSAGWTSADAAGLPILPGLVRYDEVVEAGALEHAVRFTLAKTRRAYVPPASHWASASHDEDLPPMGMRVRLKADFDLAGFGPEATVILKALKKYGMILADNGSDNFISGAPNPNWDMDALAQLKKVKTRDLEVIEMTGLVKDEKR